MVVSGHEWMEPFRNLNNLSIAYLKYSGLWQIAPRSSSFLRYIYLVYKVFTLSMMYIFTITILADMCTNMNDISVATDDGCIYAGMCVVIFKWMNFQIHRKKINGLVEKTFKCADDLCEFSNVDYIVKDIIKKYYIRNKVIFYGFTILGGILVIALLFFSPTKNGLPIRAKYPFNTTISPWRQISFAIEAFAISISGLAIVSMDGNALLLCSIITMEFDILNTCFEHCGRAVANDTCRVPNESVEPKAKGIDDSFMHRYKTCLRFHQRLVSTTNDYNRTFSSSMFVQMLSSTSIICLTGFQAVVVGGQSSDVMKFGIYLSAATSQLFYICWLGNELHYSSLVLDRSQWLSGWHCECLPGIVQVFVLSMMFSRQSVQVKASVFYVLCLETFTTIIRRSYSAFALLNSMQLESQ